MIEWIKSFRKDEPLSVKLLEDITISGRMYNKLWIKFTSRKGCGIYEELLPDYIVVPALIDKPSSIDYIINGGYSIDFRHMEFVVYREPYMINQIIKVYDLPVDQKIQLRKIAEEARSEKRTWYGKRIYDPNKYIPIYCV